MCLENLKKSNVIFFLGALNVPNGQIDGLITLKHQKYETVKYYDAIIVSKRKYIKHPVEHQPEETYQKKNWKTKDDERDNARLEQNPIKTIVVKIKMVENNFKKFINIPVDDINNTSVGSIKSEWKRSDPMTFVLWSYRQKTVI